MEERNRDEEKYDLLELQFDTTQPKLLSSAQLAAVDLQQFIFDSVNTSLVRLCRREWLRRNALFFEQTQSLQLPREWVEPENHHVIDLTFEIPLEGQLSSLSTAQLFALKFHPQAKVTPEILEDAIDELLDRRRRARLRQSAANQAGIEATATASAIREDVKIVNGSSDAPEREKQQSNKQSTADLQQVEPQNPANQSVDADMDLSQSPDPQFVAGATLKENNIANGQKTQVHIKQPSSSTTWYVQQPKFQDRVRPRSPIPRQRSPSPDYSRQRRRSSTPSSIRSRQNSSQWPQNRYERSPPDRYERPIDRRPYNNYRRSPSPRSYRLPPRY